MKSYTINGNPFLKTLLMNRGFDVVNQRVYLDFKHDGDNIIMVASTKLTETSTYSINVKPRCSAIVANLPKDIFELLPLRAGGGYRVLQTGTGNEFTVKQLNFVNSRARYAHPAFGVSEVNHTSPKHKKTASYNVDMNGFVKGSWNP